MEKFEDIPTMGPEWDFREIVKDLPRQGNLLEIGSFLGASAVAFAKEFKSAKKQWNIHCVDMFRGMAALGPTPEIREYMKKFTMDEELHLKLFKQNIEKWDNITWEKIWLGTELEIEDYEPPIEATALFYDGDHKYQPLIRFLESHCRNIPYLFIADYDLKFTGTVKAVDEYVTKYDKQLIVLNCARWNPKIMIRFEQQSPVACVL